MIGLLMAESRARGCVGEQDPGVRRRAWLAVSLSLLQ